MLKNKKLILAISIIPQYLIVKLLSKYPDIVENYYSHGIYPLISKTFRFAFGWIPFSIGDVFYTLIVIYILRWLFVNRKRIINDTKAWLIDIFSALAMLFFIFHLFWGMNYYRLPVHESLGIDNKYTSEELVRVSKKLIKTANEIHFRITKNDTIKITIPYSKQKLLKMTSNGYENLKNKYPQLAYSPRSAKQSLYSLPLTYMGFSGYLNPFTNEAQIDGLIPLHKFPTTACHEEAHQVGYAAENETNFIGCLATIFNDDSYFKYSGYIFAVRHCLNEVYKRDREQYKTLIAQVNPGIRKNYQESRDFWDAYENPFEPLFKSTYNEFLKANNQSKGIKSYSYAVALMVNYFETAL